MKENNILNKFNKYLLLEFLLDYGFLFLISAWSEFGFAYFSGLTTIDSVEYPLKHYLYPHIPNRTSEEVSHYIMLAAQILAFADAGLSILAIIDIKNKRKEFVTGMLDGFTDFKSGRINFLLFSLNALLFLISFVVNAFLPWTGLKESTYGKEFIFISGSSMFVGQMILTSLLYSKYIFSVPVKIKDFYELSRNEKIEVFKNLFSTKKGGWVVARSIASIITRGMKFYGMAEYSSKYLFESAVFTTPYAASAGLSIVYRTLFTQSLNDYKKTFTEKNLIQHGYEIISDKKSLFNLRSALVNGVKYFTVFLFTILILMVFLLRTISTPSLFTGPINNPEENFDMKDIFLSISGLIFGGLGAYQYCQFMWSLGRPAIDNVADNINGFFSKTELEESSDIMIKKRLSINT